MNLKQIAWGAGILIVLAAVFGFWASFTKPVTTPVAVETTSPVLGGTATTTGDYEYKESGPGYDISVSYPSTTGLSAEADLKARTALETGLKTIIGDFKSNAQQNLTSDELSRLTSMGTSYALGITYKPYKSTASVSYEFDVYEDTGGAHPNSYFKTFLFDTGGNQAKLSDLFDPTTKWLENLSVLVSKDVTAQLKARLQMSDVSGSIFAEGLAPKEENFQDFVIDGKDLLILIPPYQVAAYVVGSIEVRIPLSSLANDLAPGVM